MTIEERRAEVQKWVDWVNACRILGCAYPEGTSNEYIEDRRPDAVVLREWAMLPTQPAGAELYLLWHYPEDSKNYYTITSEETK